MPTACGLSGHACPRSPASEGRQLSSSAGISRDRGGLDHTELPRPEALIPREEPDPQPRSPVFPGLGARQVQDAARLKAARVIRLSAILHGGRTAISSLGEVRGTPRGEFPGHQLPRNTWDSRIYLTMKNMPSENS